MEIDDAIRQAVAAEREACAQLCTESAIRARRHGEMVVLVAMAAGIRARGTRPPAAGVTPHSQRNPWPSV